MAQFPFLKNYADWRVCIEKSCGIPLSKEFIAFRLKILTDLNQAETQRFTQQYGQDHHQTILKWFRTAKDEVDR